MGITNNHYQKSYKDWNNRELIYPAFYHSDDLSHIMSYLDTLPDEQRKTFSVTYEETFKREGRKAAQSLLDGFEHKKAATTSINKNSAAKTTTAADFYESDPDFSKPKRKRRISMLRSQLLALQTA